MTQWDSPTFGHGPVGQSNSQAWSNGAFIADYYTTKHKILGKPFIRNNSAVWFIHTHIIC